MSSLYLDTNIFIYLADKNSPYHKSCQALINYCQDKKILIATSTETIQEIIHYAKNTKQLKVGLKVAKKVLELIDQLYSIDENTIKIYLEKVELYKNAKSRDIIHLGVCLRNKLDTIITYDKEFKSFKEIKVLPPQEILD
ncbi:type II toxin-antitoxin system VapC family toxin [Candidatus Daviesbacteria bacterium]|nr:type II toxin-antitoxin system VapC family toxin [Candidatus Daviesbacteria bacterium]